MIRAMERGSILTPLRTAFEGRNHEAILEALAPDVILRSPMRTTAAAAPKLRGDKPSG